MNHKNSLGTEPLSVIIGQIENTQKLAEKIMRAIKETEEINNH